MKLPNDIPLHRFGAPFEKAQRVVILLHGRGSSAKGIARLAEAFPAETIAYLAPFAPYGSWYPRRFLAPLDANEPALSNALDVVSNLIREAGASGISEDCVGLIGFSQGACLALEYAARHPKRYAFVAALSGALIGPIDSPARQGDLAGTPVLVGCAEHDAHIPLAHVEKSVAELSAMGANVAKQVFDSSSHTIYPQEVRWIEGQLRADRWR